MKRWSQRPEASNWGDFGEADQLGKMNLLTAQHRRKAAAEVSEGLAFTLSLPLDYPGGTALNPHRKPPKFIATAIEDEEGGINYHRCLSRYGLHFHDVTNDDSVLLYPQYSTHWDALAHFGQEFDADSDGVAEIRFYNGFGIESVVHPDRGGPRADALGVENLAFAGVQGRGVLIDLHTAYGTARERIGYDALMRLIDTQTAEVGEGDFLCIYTGFADAILAQNKRPDAKFFRNSFVGLDGSDQKLLQWISASGIVAICADNPSVEYVSVKPRSETRHSMLPLHEHCLFKIGVHLGELWWFEQLAAWLRDHNRRSFLLTAPPLRLTGAVGAPVTPIATV